MLSALRRRASSKAPRTRRPAQPTRHRPILEALEDRTAPQTDDYVRGWAPELPQVDTELPDFLRRNVPAR